MPKIVKLFEYTGRIDYEIIDKILKNFRKIQISHALTGTAGRRTYAIMVECLENIVKYSDKKSWTIKQPYIALFKEDSHIMIKSGNPLPVKEMQLVRTFIDIINSKNETDLLKMYDQKINSERNPEGNGCGLGFMLMKLRSGNNIAYRFTGMDASSSYLEIEIHVKEICMRKLIIGRTSSSPAVILDADANRFEISGESRPPDITAFYGEIINWIDDFHLYLSQSKAKGEYVFNFDFEYFNSSSAKYILDLCKKIENIRAKGTDISVRWHYELDDTDMLEVGREMSRMAKLNFEFVEKVTR
jgi:hypothetical protein